MRPKQTFLRLVSSTAVAAASLLGLTSQAHAGAIYSAVSAVINSGGPGFGTLTVTFNQAGLSSGYTSGVTDFDNYSELPRARLAIVEALSTHLAEWIATGRVDVGLVHNPEPQPDLETTPALEEALSIGPGSSLTVGGIYSPHVFLQPSP